MNSRTLRLTLSCAALLLEACQGAPPDTGIEAITQELQVVGLKPTSDVAKTSVVGVGDTSSLFRNVDDGTASSSSDGDGTYVRSNASTASHRTGYSGAPAGKVTAAVVNYRARSSSASGTAQIKLFDGSTLVGTGAVRTLGSSYANFSESFSGLNVASGNTLRTEVTFKRTSGTGNLRYTLIWINATIDDGAPTVSLTAPAANATVRGTVLVTATASDNVGVTRVEFSVDGVVRGSDTSSPYSFLWDAFHETLDSRSARAHKLKATAFDADGKSTATAERAVKVVPAAAGDCNGDGVVNSTDVTAIGTEIGDGDGSGTEQTPGGSFAGNPACDANEDNVINAADQTCAQAIISGGAQACLDVAGPLVKPIIFAPTDFTVSAADTTFVIEKVQETRRFYAKNNGGKTFRALPVEVVHGFKAHQDYWIDGQNYELGVLQELQDRGYPAHVDWAQTPWNRVTWVWGLGSGAWAGERHYPTGHGFGIIGDAVLYAGMDLDCHRVTEPLPGGNGTVAACQDWLARQQIYGFGVGAFVHELGHGFILEHPPAEQFDFTVMGGHWNYPNTGLVDADRAFLAVSHYFPGFVDPVSPTATIVTPASGATVSGFVTIEGRATDNYGVRAMHLFIDNVEKALPPLFSPDDHTLGFQFTWDTATVGAGNHTIRVTADDVGGRTGTTSITVRK